MVVATFGAQPLFHIRPLGRNHFFIPDLRGAATFLLPPCGAYFLFKPRELERRPDINSHAELLVVHPGNLTTGVKPFLQVKGQHPSKPNSLMPPIP